MEKKFEIPEAIIIDFENDDIITGSGPGYRWGLNGDEWQNGDDF